MCGPGFQALPSDIDYADPETDSLCMFCESVLDDSGECMVCAPRCLLEDTPLRGWGFVIDATGGVRELTGPAS